MIRPELELVANDLGNLVVAAGRFPPASADLRDARDLLRRVDTKYVVSRDDAAQVLERIAGDYAALIVPSGNVATYKSLYFDTAELRCFHDHRRGRRRRHKIRIRHYPDRLLSFLEVKTKRNAVVTDKRRVPIPFREEWLGAAEQQFVAEHVSFPIDDLRPVMRIDFRRLSLVGLASAERVTVDLALTAEGLDGSRWSFGDLVIIEVKQAPFCLRTPVMRALAAARLREGAMSKYTIATALLRPELRRNLLLPEVRRIERMST